MTVGMFNLNYYIIMAVFSTNQNRHLFVANAYKDIKGEKTSQQIATLLTTTGDLGVRCVGGDLYFMYKGVDGQMKSDKIQLKNLDYVKAFSAADMRIPLKKIEIELAANPIAGQDYVLRINFKNFFGMSDQHQYFKDAAVRATTGMTKAQFMAKMKSALDLSFSREIGASATENPYLTFTVNSDKLVIEEKEQEWTLGTQNLERVHFDVQPTTVFDGTTDVIWAKQNANTGYYYTDVTPAKYVEDSTSSETPKPLIPNPAIVVGTNAIGNGKQIADLEWFCMGERGDQFRMMGYPNYIPTRYLVNPNNEYNVLEIHHAFTDTGVNSYRGEKDITIVAETAAVINSIIADINTLAGTEFESL